MITPRRIPPRLRSLILLILLAGSLTLILQKWVGGVTLYDASLAERKMVMHESILHNHPPPGEKPWTKMGASNGTNIRVAVVYWVEAVHRVTNLEVLKVYRLLDTVALFAVLGLLFFYLRQTAPPSHSVAGFLYVAAILPLTYFFAYFQPWDRVSLACWIGLIMLLRAKRLIAFTVLLAFSMTIKFDTILLPGLYLLANISRDNWRRVVLRSALMFGVSFAVLVGLIVLLPRGFEGGSMAAQLLINLRGLRATLFSYPPLLGFLLPFILAVIGLRQADRFSRACVAFGTLLLVPLVASTNFIEIRAELPMLVLLLPAACKGLAILCREESDAGSVVFARDPESAYAGAGSAHALLGEGWAEGWVGWSVARAPAETLAFAPRGITSLSTLPPDDFPAIVDSLDAS